MAVLAFCGTSISDSSDECCIRIVKKLYIASSVYAALSKEALLWQKYMAVSDAVYAGSSPRFEPQIFHQAGCICFFWHTLSIEWYWLLFSGILVVLQSHSIAQIRTCKDNGCRKSLSHKSPYWDRSSVLRNSWASRINPVQLGSLKPKTNLHYHLKWCFNTKQAGSQLLDGFNMQMRPCHSTQRENQSYHKVSLQFLARYEERPIPIFKDSCLFSNVIILKAYLERVFASKRGVLFICLGLTIQQCQNWLLDHS